MLLAGYEILQEELKRLKTVERPAVIRAIEVAREHGDLSENAEYHAAKDSQGMIEARVKDLEANLSRAEIIDPTTLSGERVIFGATVTVVDQDDKELIYQIVGRFETDVKLRRISNSSPLGRALIGKKVGDEIEVETPSGEKFYEIVRLEFV
jgi:transcription elongation factor GreA